jgi:hypothetical protein
VSDHITNRGSHGCITSCSHDNHGLLVSQPHACPKCVMPDITSCSTSQVRVEAEPYCPPSSSILVCSKQPPRPHLRVHARKEGLNSCYSRCRDAGLEMARRSVCCWPAAPCRAAQAADTLCCFLLLVVVLLCFTVCVVKQPLRPCEGRLQRNRHKKTALTGQKPVLLGAGKLQRQSRRNGSPTKPDCTARVSSSTTQTV